MIVKLNAAPSARRGTWRVARLDDRRRTAPYHNGAIALAATAEVAGLIMESGMCMADLAGEDPSCRALIVTPGLPGVNAQGTHYHGAKAGTLDHPGRTAMDYAIPVRAGHAPRLDAIAPDQHAELDRYEAAEIRARLGEELGELADLLFYAGAHSLLVVLQGRDTAGKDGAIRRILDCVNAQSCRVVPFKTPTEDELSHDFLRRVHAQTPGRGSIALFNRSHYEDVLIVRVRNLAPKHVWQRRYEHINAFEELLLDSGTILVKILLHISKDEQEERLLEREKEPEKSWKLNVGDWQERRYWEAYTEAYDEVLKRCSTERAPWYVIPANHKWFRDVAVLECIVHALRPHRDEWEEHLKALGKERRRELETFRATQP